MRKEAPNFAENEEAREKLEMLYRLYMPRLLHMARRILKDPYDAEGIVQSAFIKAMYILDEIEDPEAKRTYALLATIVRNLCYDYRRKRKYEELTDFDEMEWDVIDTKSPEAIYLDKEGKREFLALLGTMPEKYRAPMVLHYVHDLPVKEVAKVLGITQNLASVRLLRGRNYVLGELGKQRGKEDGSK